MRRLGDFTSLFRRPIGPKADPAAPAPMSADTAGSLLHDGTVLHVLDQEARVYLENGILSVGRQDAPPTRLRLPDLASISIHGRASLTTPCVHALLAEGIPVVWRSAGGYYLGQTVDLSGGTARVRQAQYGATGTVLAEALALRLVAGKIAAMQRMLRHRADVPEVRAALATLRAQADRLPGVPPSALLGVEGAATAAYFACWPALLRGPAAGLGFPGRTRRPPRDPVNAVLSYLYAVLTGHCASAALAAGLDPVVGVLHAPRAGRPALALDLVEPFRAAVADGAALAALNRGEIGVGDTEPGDDGIRLSTSGRHAVLQALERRLNSACHGGDADTVSWRTAIDRAARSLAAALVAGRADLLELAGTR